MRPTSSMARKRNDRNLSGGGVLIAVNDAYITSSVPELQTDCEIVWCKMEIIGHKTVYLSSYYNPKTSNEKGYTEYGISIERASNVRNAFIISAGDFNLPEGKGVDLGQYKGKITLVVNVASECGYTDNHYKALSKIHNHLVTTGRFSVLAFPCNQFGKQEPGTNAEIQKFAKDRYRAKFPVFGKVNVIESDVSPAWQYLIDETGEAPSWNFFKYLVNENGDVLHAWGAWTSVDEIYSVVQQAVTNAMRRPKTEL
ncbi:bsaA [Mytilus edulis]|uniref:Glutathione peroxidase n=1 Tax=Mytilus edulis TaxID=6550 RepID=A0A8S3UFQ4_MYTED|nr:bsaA [Mytilus edulis]